MLVVITVGLPTYVDAPQAQRDLAIVRTVGVRQDVVPSSVLMTATLLVILGAMLGVAPARGGTMLVGQVVADRLSVGLSASRL